MNDSLDASLLTAEEEQTLQARRDMRALGRQLQSDANVVALHAKRLQAAQALGGIEPLQGCLADLFYGPLPARAHEIRQLSCELADLYLPRHIAQAFTRLFKAQTQLPAINPLATRWSVLTQPCAAVPARTRRASVDSSQGMAQAIVNALQSHDTDNAERAQQEFLAHCLACHDKLAFMLARRDLLRLGINLNSAWQQAGQQLELSA